MKNRKVLFVEDDRITLATIKRTVKNEWYQPLFSESASRAIEIMQSEEIDVVVTDLMMPEMDGLELIDWMKGNRLQAIRVIVSSANDTETLLEAINRGSVYRYVVKPWNKEEFKIVVRQSLAMSLIQKERQRLVTELESANHKLHATVQYRTKQVLELYNQAEIGKYTAQLVHNLNNPLMAIFGALDISRQAIEQAAPDRKVLERMHTLLSRNADNLQKIIRAVPLHAKDRALYQNEAVDINALVADEMELFNLNKTFQLDISKQLDLGDDLPPVFGNYVQIKQILDDLIKNATDAMEETRDKILTIATLYEEGWVRIVISDTGEGISSENLEKIFLPDFSTKPKGKGTGLGLASVRSMVSAYNGDVNVQSATGRGTTFTVRLPAYYPEEAPS